MKKILFLISCLSFCLFGVCLFGRCDKIPVEILFSDPATFAIRLSPSGNKLSYISEFGGKLNIWIKNLLDPSVPDYPVTFDKDQGISNYSWLPCCDNKMFYMQDHNGDENTKIYLLDLDTLEVRCITPFENSKNYIAAVSDKIKDKILIGSNKDNPRNFNIYSCDLNTLDLNLIQTDPGNVYMNLIDDDFELRAKILINADGSKSLFCRKKLSSEWFCCMNWAIDDGQMSLVGFLDDDNTILIFDSKNIDTNRLISFNIETGKEEILFCNEAEEVNSIIFDPEEKKILAVSYHTEKPRYEFFDSEYEKFINSLTDFMENSFPFVVSKTKDQSKCVVYFSSDDSTGSYYLFEKDKEPEFLFDFLPELNEYELAPMEPFSYVARDGLLIHGYVTFPLYKEKSNLPMMLVVHGGPQSRDLWGFDSCVQYFSNRGYMVVQVNFRGSTGFGKSFLNAGNKEWGGKMQDDLLDAVKWAVDLGYADPNRIGIFGGSYGGYAALMGVTHTPDVFKCCVDICGVSDIINLINSIPPYWEQLMSDIYMRIGHPELDKELLDSRSPLLKAANVKVPVFVVQGANDPRVKQSASDAIVKALKENNVPHHYLLFEDEGHGISKFSNRMLFFHQLEEFLEAHLPA